MIRLLICLIFCFMVGCGKVAQDISNQSTNSIFKSVNLIVQHEDFEPFGWDAMPVSTNVVSIYAQAKGLIFEKGYETIAWGSAEANVEVVGTKNTLVVTNYDQKRNVVDSSHYQQGYFQFQEVVTDNYKLLTQFRKIRPKYNIYSFVHYQSKSRYLFHLTDAIPTKDIQVSPYTHLVSVLYSQHLQKESYNQESLIPLNEFYAIIPTGSATASAMIFPTNNIKIFKVNDPLFSFDDGYFNALLTIVDLSYYGDEYDALSYIEAKQKTAIFTADEAGHLTRSIKQYFKKKVNSNEPFSKPPTANIND